MNIKQLRDYLDVLLSSGADPNTPVCVPAAFQPEPWEVDDITVLAGPFREDPSPKLSAFGLSVGTFLFLETAEDYDEIDFDRYSRISSPPVPIKERIGARTR